MKHDFTLIELLMTVGIIVILAGILVPVVTGSIKKGEQAKAKAEIVTLVNAIKQYENTYNKLPVPNVDGYSNKMSAAKDVADGLVKALQGDETIKNAADKSVNPRKVKFMDKRNTGAGDYADPWGNSYKIIINADEEIPLSSVYSSDTTGAKIFQSVVIWSAGPDGNWGTKDDVHSFEAEYEAGQWHLTN